MKFGFITALTSFEQEDLVVESLIPREFTLLCRAMQPEELLRELEALESDQRVIVIVDELFGLTAFEISQIRSENIACLEISTETLVSRDEITALVDSALRKPDKTTAIQKRVAGSKKWIAFTGSSGSPGITTVALNVAAEIALMHDVNLIDADPNRSDLNTLLVVKTDELQTQLHPRLLLWNQSAVQSLEQVSEAINESKERLTCIDLGDAPDISEMLTDRRDKGKRYLETFLRCGRVVYVAQPDNHGLHEMEEFSYAVRESFPYLPITFVLNKAGTTNRQQAMQKRFRAKVKNADNFLMPREDSIVDRAQGRYATVLEISPRSSLRKSLKLLSAHLADFN